MLRMYMVIGLLSVLLIGCSAESFDSHPSPAVSEAQYKIETPKQDTHAASSVSDDPYKMTIGGNAVGVKASISGSKPHFSYDITLSTGENLKGKIDGQSARFIQYESNGKQALLLESVDEGLDGKTYLTSLVQENGRLTLKKLDTRKIKLKEVTKKNAPQDLQKLIAEKQLQSFDIEPSGPITPSNGFLSGNYRVGKKTVILNGNAKFSYDFDAHHLKIERIDSYQYSDPLSQKGCEGIQQTDLGYSVAEKDRNYDILTAILYKREEIVERFVNCGQSPDYVADKGKLTPLMKAIVSRNPKMVDKLLDYGADPTLRVGDYSAYFIANYLNHYYNDDRVVEIEARLRSYKTETDKQALKLLSLPAVSEVPSLAKSVNINISLSDIYETYGTPLAAALYNGDIELVKALLKHGADPKEKFLTVDGETTPIVYAADTKKFEEAQLLLQAGIDINAQTEINKSTFTLLAKAISDCDTERVEFLLDHGAWAIYYSDPNVNEGKPITLGSQLIKTSCMNTNRFLAWFK